MARTGPPNIPFLLLETSKGVLLEGDAQDMPTQGCAQAAATWLESGAHVLQEWHAVGCPAPPQIPFLFREKDSIEQFRGRVV